ncbi:hypothetical protein ACJX0J_032527, partial [Zea mays]
IQPILLTNISEVTIFGFLDATYFRKKLINIVQEKLKFRTAHKILSECTLVNIFTHMDEGSTGAQEQAASRLQGHEARPCSKSGAIWKRWLACASLGSITGSPVTTILWCVKTAYTLAFTNRFNKNSFYIREQYRQPILTEIFGIKLKKKSSRAQVTAIFTFYIESAVHITAKCNQHIQIPKGAPRMHRTPASPTFHKIFSYFVIYGLVVVIYASKGSSELA